MKFGTDYFFDTRTKFVEIGYDRSIITLSPHTNVIAKKWVYQRKMLKYVGRATIL